MSEEMGDAEFLRYCEAHASTPRAGFIGEHLKRLFRLAGRPEPGVEDREIISFHGADFMAREAMKRLQI